MPASGGGTLSGVGQDVLRFVPSKLGATTAGAWSMYFDGSDVGLTTADENIDAVGVLADGRVLISTTGPFSVTGVSAGQDEDLAAFAPTSLGSNTAGAWSLYFDGSDVGLATNDNEDIDALDILESAGNPRLFFSTVGNFAVAGASGANEDVLAFNQTTVGSNTAGTFGPGLAFDGSVYGLGAFNLDGIDFSSTSSAIAARSRTHRHEPESCDGFRPGPRRHCRRPGRSHRAQWRSRYDIGRLQPSRRYCIDPWRRTIAYHQVEAPTALSATAATKTETRSETQCQPVELDAYFASLGIVIKLSIRSELAS